MLQAQLWYKLITSPIPHNATNLLELLKYRFIDKTLPKNVSNML